MLIISSRRAHLCLQGSTSTNSISSTSHILSPGSENLNNSLCTSCLSVTGCDMEPAVTQPCGVCVSVVHNMSLSQLGSGPLCSLNTSRLHWFLLAWPVAPVCCVWLLSNARYSCIMTEPDAAHRLGVVHLHVLLLTSLHIHPLSVVRPSGGRGKDGCRGGNGLARGVVSSSLCLVRLHSAHPHHRPVVCPRGRGTSRRKKEELSREETQREMLGSSSGIFKYNSQTHW